MMQEVSCLRGAQLKKDAQGLLNMGGPCHHLFTDPLDIQPGVLRTPNIESNIFSRANIRICFCKELLYKQVSTRHDKNLSNSRTG